MGSSCRVQKIDLHLDINSPYLRFIIQASQAKKEGRIDSMSMNNYTPEFTSMTDQGGERFAQHLAKPCRVYLKGGLILHQSPSDNQRIQ